MAKTLKDLSVVWDDEALKALINVRRYLSYAVKLANETDSWADPRGLSIAKTKVDEALLWICQARGTTVNDMLGEYTKENDNSAADIDYINELFKEPGRGVNPLTGESVPATK